MGIKRDVLGFRYDEDLPAFCELVGGWYYHLRTKRRFNKDEFDAKLVVDGKAFAVDEVGVPPLDYILAHEYILWGVVVPESTPAAPIDATVTKVPSGADDTGEITVTGGPSDGVYQITVTTQDSTSGAASKPVTYALTGEETDAVAKRVGAMAHDPNLSDVVVVGDIITFTPSAGGSIDVLEVVVVSSGAGS